jgi:hypothetical protein
MAYGYNQTPVGMGASGIARNRIAQALMRVQNPPPALRVPGLQQQRPMPGGPPAAGGLPGLPPQGMPQPGMPPPQGMPGAMPGAMPAAATGIPGVPPQPGGLMPGMPSDAYGGGNDYAPTPSVPPVPPPGMAQQY